MLTFTMHGGNPKKIGKSLFQLMMSTSIDGGRGDSVYWDGGQDMLDQNEFKPPREKTCFPCRYLVLHRVDDASKMDLFFPTRNQRNSQIFLGELVLGETSIVMDTLGNSITSPVMKKKTTLGDVDQLS